MRNCLVAQSGGPTVAINASLAGVIQGAIDSKEFKTVYGSLNGVQGLLNGRLMDLTKKEIKNDKGSVYQNNFFKTYKHIPRITRF